MLMLCSILWFGPCWFQYISCKDSHHPWHMHYIASETNNSNFIGCTALNHNLFKWQIISQEVSFGNDWFLVIVFPSQPFVVGDCLLEAMFYCSLSLGLSDWMLFQHGLHLGSMNLFTGGRGSTCPFFCNKISLSECGLGFWGWVGDH